MNMDYILKIIKIINRIIIANLPKFIYYEVCIKDK